MQYLAGELAVEAGMLLPLRAAHNTVAMRFDIEVYNLARTSCRGPELPAESGT